MLARLITFFLLMVASGAAQSGPSAPAAHPLSWDALEKTLEVKPGDGAADFEFQVTNTSQAPVQIVDLRPSCGCTVAELPSRPWVIAPGAKGSFRGTIDFRGKHGRVQKSLFVDSTAGTQVLAIIVNLPEAPGPSREGNQAIAARDRQAVFKGDCASCHAAPAQGRSGDELFAAVCGVCHLAPHRASMVPDLTVATAPRDAAYWRAWISDGKEGTLMPAFAAKHGGPLTEEQIASLIAFALERLPTQPRRE